MNYLCRPGIRMDQQAKVEAITKVICQHFKVTESELQSRTRKRRVSYPRQVAYHLLLSHTKCSSTAIGKYFGRDHTTVLYGNQTVQGLLEYDTEKREEMESLRQRLRM